MFGRPHFHHNIIRKLNSVFGTLFNDIDIKRFDSDGKEIETIRVPLSYAPKQKWYNLVFANNRRDDVGQGPFSVKVPSMGFEMTTLLYDTTRKVNRLNKITNGSFTQGNRIQGFTPAPYTFEFSLYVFANKTSDWTQIIEQIVPNFNPSFNVPIRMVQSQTGAQDIVQDVHITLTSVSPDANVYGDFRTRTTYTWTLTFSVVASMFGYFDDSTGGVIGGSEVGGSDPAVLIRFWNDDDGKLEIGNRTEPLMTFEMPES